MIAIIADDFTGAAELAGISLRYGLKVELCTGEVIATGADVLIVSTDSRSLNKAAALQKTEEVLKQVLQLNPEWIYKKIDSVLRGYVLDELKVQMQWMNKSKAFILPANPSFGRTISNGMYFVQGKPISETGFAADPEFPVSSSMVPAILNNDTLRVVKQPDELTGDGFFVGEAVAEEGVKAWAGAMNEGFVLAGAGDFYTALLQQRFKEQQAATFNLQLPLLYVCGTSFDQSVNFVKQVHEKSPVVLYINKQMLEQSIVDDEWLQACNEILTGEKKAIIAFRREMIPGEMPAVDLRGIMAKAVQAVVKENDIVELFIEGGSTATAILQELSINHLMPVNEISRGVVRMKAGSLFITVKPGSYELPNEIKEQFGNWFAG